MILSDKFYKFYRPYLNIISQTIASGGVSVLVGINSSGKTLLKEQIVSPKFKEEFIRVKKIHLVSLEFKDQTPISPEQIMKYWLTETAKILGKKLQIIEELDEYVFNITMNEWIRNLDKDESLTYVLLDLQNITGMPESFFTSLMYFYIYSYGKISFILLSEPHILESENPALSRFIQRFIKNKFIFLKNFDRLTALADIELQSRLLNTDFKKYRPLILRYSNGLHGVIRTFCYLLKDNPEVSNIKALMKIVYEDKLCQFWVNEVLDSLPGQSLRILKIASTDKNLFRKYKNNYYAKWLIKLNFIKNNGSFRYPLLIPFLNRYSKVRNTENKVIKFSKNQFYFQNEKIDLTRNEKEVLEKLYRSKGKLVTYDAIGEKLWKSNPDQFSLWAISQIIRRLRKKLSIYSINPKIITSQRSEGYILN